jgi:NAD(P)-dependent dehydrogenase (short-subunit alcohol dehydrogenase family)
MGALEGPGTIITGAGRGLGPEYGRLFAREGAKVVANDLGSDYTARIRHRFRSAGD